jgi:fructokinase
MKDEDAGPVLCFGEILWDSLPRGLFPGGAPLNVAYHLRRLGMEPLLVSAVGQDRLGDELRRRLEFWEISTVGLVELDDLATGVSRVALVGDSPSFEIPGEAAWDRIDLTEEVRLRAGASPALVFGTLAQRSESNMRQLVALLELCPRALKVCDLNLRAPFDDVDRAWSLARRANLVKLNDQELARMLGEELEPPDFANAVRRFAGEAGVQRVCLTAGALGAGLHFDGTWYWRSIRPVPVRDTVGAGDAFLAALIFGLLRAADSPEGLLRRACRLARFVATRDGGTPDYRADSEGNVVSQRSLL